VPLELALVTVAMLVGLLEKGRYLMSACESGEAEPLFDLSDCTDLGVGRLGCWYVYALGMLVGWEALLITVLYVGIGDASYYIHTIRGA